MTNTAMLAIHLADYILDSERLDFFNQVATGELGLTDLETDLLVRWGNDDTSTTAATKVVFSKLKGRHIYATAVCFTYNLKQLPSPIDTIPQV